MPPPRRTSLRLRALAAISTTACVALAGCGGCGSSSHQATQPVKPLQPHRQTHTGFHRAPLISIFEADRQLHEDPAGTLDLLKSLGADTVRVFVPWGSIGGLSGIAPASDSHQPPPGFHASDPGSYPAASWAGYDAIVRAAHERGVRVYMVLGPPPPLWARGPGDPEHPIHTQWRAMAPQFGDFVHAMGTRYSGHYSPAGAGSTLPRVDFWGLWNEPNFGPMLAPQSLNNGQLEVSPALYRPLLDAGWSALHATGHGHDTILIGELAPRGVSLGRGPGLFGYMVPLRFVRALYCVDASLQPLRGSAARQRQCPTTQAGTKGFPAQHPGLFQATGFAVHPYEFGPPTVATPAEPDYVDLATLPKFESVIDTITAGYGSKRRFPIYNTEFGYETNPPEKVFGTVSPAVAATYLNESEFLSWRDPRIKSYDQYLLVDAPNATFATALEFFGGTPKPTYDAYRLAIWMPRTTGTPAQPLEIWGCVRAAGFARAQTGRRQRVLIEFRAAGGGAFRPLRTVRLSDPHGYFDIRTRLPGDGAVRLAWTPPAGATVHSRVVDVKINATGKA